MEATDQSQGFKLVQDGGFHCLKFVLQKRDYMRKIDLKDLTDSSVYLFTKNHRNEYDFFGQGTCPSSCVYVLV